MLIEKACPICNGDVFREELEYGQVTYRCLQAGHTVTEEHIKKVLAERGKLRESVQVTEKKEAGMPAGKGQKGGNTWERSQYYLAHQREIIVTFLTNGGSGLHLQWGIGSATWTQRGGVEERWHDEIVRIAAELGIEYNRDMHMKYKTAKAPDKRKKKEHPSAYYEGYRQVLLDIFGSRGAVEKVLSAVTRKIENND